ncbi:hypothetical protein SK128_020806, partial [Halocaridina rubra]
TGKSDSNKEIKAKCPAKIILKEVLKFPDYKIQSSCEKKDMQKFSQVLRNDLKHGATVMESRIYIDFPKPEDHVHISTIEEKKPSKRCLVCNAILLSSTRSAFAIFSKEVRTSHRQLEVHSLLSEVLKQDLVAQDLHSTVVCSKCFNLLDDIDFLEKQLSYKRQDIAEKYSRTANLAIEDRETLNESCCDIKIGNDDGGREDYALRHRKINGKGTPTKTGRRGRPLHYHKRKGRGRFRGKSSSVIPQSASDKRKVVGFLQRYKKDNEGFLKMRPIRNKKDLGSEKDSKERVNTFICGVSENNISDSPTANNNYKTSRHQETHDICSDTSSHQLTTEPNNTSTCQEPLEENVSTSLLKDHENINNASQFVRVPENSDNSYSLEKGPVKSKRTIFLKIPNLIKIAGQSNSADSQEVSEKSIVKIEYDEDNIKPIPVMMLPSTNSTTAPSLKENLKTNCMLSSFDQSEEYSIDAEMDSDSTECSASVKIEGEQQMRKKRQKRKQNGMFSCSECSEKFFTRAEVRQHIKLHPRSLNYDCKQCSKSFLDKYRLKAHLKTHGEREKSYSCDICHRSYYNSYHLKRHTKTHAEGEAGQYVCNVCGKVLSTQNGLDSHMLTHTGEKPFQCEHCGATFRQMSNLNTHIKELHLQKKNHTCQICQASFVRRRLLDYHINRVHTGERPYKCETCGAGFVYPHCYRTHLRKHTGDKPFECHICSKQFSTRENRNAHMYVHSKKKPYECKICGAGFMRKPLCVAHISSHSFTGNPADKISFNSPKLLLSSYKTSQKNITSDEMKRAIAAVSIGDHIDDSEDRTQLVIATDDRRVENVEHYFTTLQHVVEVQPEDF